MSPVRSVRFVVGRVAVAVPQIKAIAIVNVARFIAPHLYHFVIAVWRAKQAESAA
jgi:hypothetical protein